MAKHAPFDISTPEGRKRANKQLEWKDHGILRHRWHNFEEFAPGAFRSNNPSHDRFREYAAMGIKSVLHLRGDYPVPAYLFEEELCRELGLTLINLQLTAWLAPEVDRLIQLMETFDSIEKPFLVHCKSGADRTGLAAAIYVLRKGTPLDVAKGQLSFKYMHIRRGATGILDHFLELYEADFVKTGIGIEDWIKTYYVPETLTQSFAAKQKSLRFWQGWR